MEGESCPKTVFRQQKSRTTGSDSFRFRNPVSGVDFLCCYPAFYLHSDHVIFSGKLSTPISNGGLIFTAPLRYAGSAPWAGFTDTIHAGCLLSGGHLSFEFIIFFLVSNIFPNRFLVHIADCCNVISSCPEMLISSFCSKLWMSVKQHQRTFTFQVRHEI